MESFSHALIEGFHSWWQTWLAAMESFSYIQEYFTTERMWVLKEQGIAERQHIGGEWRWIVLHRRGTKDAFPKDERRIGLGRP